MKALLLFIPLGLLLLTSGCFMTTSKVQEMIDASHQDYSKTSQAHQDSIDILKKSAATTLEQNEQQAAEIDSLEKQLEAAAAQLKPMQGNAEAAKVMSAANTVKVAELADAVAANQESIDETAEKMETIDKLFEEVMIGHFESIVASANEAIDALQVDDVVASNGTFSGLAAPIEIVAPDTSASTNTTPGSNSVSAPVN